MTQQQKRIKLAEFEGWSRYSALSTHGWIEGKPETDGEILKYFEDLNAVRNLEEKLTDDQWTDYLNNLYYITFKPAAKDRDKQAVHASAEDKCEALGQTLKLW